MWPVDAQASAPSAGDARLLEGLSAATAPVVVGCAQPAGCTQLAPTRITEEGGGAGWSAANRSSVALAKNAEEAAHQLHDLGLATTNLETLLPKDSAFLVVAAASGSDETPVVHATLSATSARLALSLLSAANTTVDLFVTAIADHRATTATPTATLPLEQVKVSGNASNYEQIVATTLEPGKGLIVESAALLGPADLSGLDLGPDGARLFSDTRFVTRLRGRVAAGAQDETLSFASSPDTAVSRRIDACGKPSSGCASAGSAEIWMIALAVLWHRMKNLL